MHLAARHLRCLAGLLLAATPGRAGDRILPLEALPDPGALVPTSTALCDLDGDGQADLLAGEATTSAVQDNVALWRGLSRGRFTRLGSIDLVGAVRSILARDFDDDGAPDVLVSAFGPGGANALWLARGHGDGSFDAATPQPALPAGARALAAADFDEDGHLDLLATTSGGAPVLAPGHGDGSFAEPVLLPAAEPGSFALQFVDAPDLDRDGHADTLLIDGASSPPRAMAWLGHGDGSFDAPIKTLLSAPAGSVLSRPTVGFVDADAWPDFVIAESTQLRTLLGTGDGHFVEQFMPLPPGAPGYSGTALGDFDGDQITDALVVRPARILRGHGDGSWDAPVFAAPTAAVRALAADLDGNGRSDVLFNDIDMPCLSVVTDDGAGGLRAGTTLLEPFSVDHVEAADFDGDGRIDLLAPGVKLLLAQPDGSYVSAGPWLFGADQLNDLEHGDLDGDGAPDGLAAGWSTFALVGAVQAFLNGGGGTLLPQDVQVLPGQIVDSALADLDADGALDVLALSATALQVLRGDGDGGFAKPVSVPGGGLDVDAGDVTGDGLIDVVLCGGLPRLVTGNGTAMPGPGVPLPGDGVMSLEANEAALGDLDGNGTLDIALAGRVLPAVTGVLRALLSLGGGAFALQDSAASNFFCLDIELADLSGDGRLDVIESASSAPDLLLAVGLGDGRFGQPRGHAGPQQPRDVDVADLDGDGRLDLIAGGVIAAQQVIVLLHGAPGGPFASVGLGSLGSRGVPVLDADEIPDAVRLVLRSARPTAPLLLVVGLQPALAPMHGGTLVPSPDVVVSSLLTDASGGLELVARWPSDLPAGASSLVQAWIADPAGTTGLAASNGVLLVAD